MSDRQPQSLPEKKHWFTQKEDVYRRKHILLGAAAMSALVCAYVLLILTSGNAVDKDIVLREMTVVAWSEVYNAPKVGGKNLTPQVTVSVYWYFSGWCFETIGVTLVDDRGSDYYDIDPGDDDYHKIMDLGPKEEELYDFSEKRFAECVGHRSGAAFDVEGIMSYIDGVVETNDVLQLSRTFKPVAPSLKADFLLAPLVLYVLFLLATVGGWTWRLAANRWTLPRKLGRYSISTALHMVATVFLTLATVFAQVVSGIANIILGKYLKESLHTVSQSFIMTIWVTLIAQLFVMFILYEAHKIAKSIKNPETYANGLPQVPPLAPPPARDSRRQSEEEDLPQYARHDPEAGAVPGLDDEVRMGEDVELDELGVDHGRTPTYEEAIRDGSSGRSPSYVRHASTSRQAPEESPEVVVGGR